MMQLTIVGFGNQAKAWAENLRDSHFPHQVALLPGSASFEKAHQLKIKTLEVGTVQFYDQEAYALLTPDHTHSTFLATHAPKMKPGTVIIYAHGHSLLKNAFQLKYPHLSHILFAPKSIGSELRRQYQLQGKLGAVYSLEHLKGDQTQLKNWLMNLSRSLGINLGPYLTTFKHETEADLFSEQGLLCSLIPYTASLMFDELIENGIEPELAYFECWHELKLIVNAMVDKGPQGFYDLISPNALIGSEKGYQKLLTHDFKLRMTQLLKDIKTGAFEDELDRTQVQQLRTTINQRWENSSLMKTFNSIHQDQS